MHKKKVTHFLDWRCHDNIIIDELSHYTLNVLLQKDKKNNILKLHRNDFLEMSGDISSQEISLWNPPDNDQVIQIKTFNGIPIILDNSIPEKCVVIEVKIR